MTSEKSLRNLSSDIFENGLDVFDSSLYYVLETVQN